MIFISKKSTTFYSPFVRPFFCFLSFYNFYYSCVLFPRLSSVTFVSCIYFGEDYTCQSIIALLWFNTGRTLGSIGNLRIDNCLGLVSG